MPIVQASYVSSYHFVISTANFDLAEKKVLNLCIFNKNATHGSELFTRNSAAPSDFPRLYTWELHLYDLGEPTFGNYKWRAGLTLILLWLGKYPSFLLPAVVML